MTTGVGTGRPSASTIDEKIQQDGEMIIVNRRYIIDKVACSFGLRLFVNPLCTLLSKRLSLHYNNEKKTGAIKLKRLSRDHNKYQL